MAFSKVAKQKTLADRITVSGIGVHSGEPVTMRLCPADANSGISFLRSNVPGSADVLIRAVSSSVGATELCTVLGDPRGVFVSTVEHLLAAFIALGVDNALVEIDGPEVPIMDGSSDVFVKAIDSVGLVPQGAAKRYLKILRPVRVDAGAAFAEFLPFEGSRYEVGLEFSCPVIGRQSYTVDLTPGAFRKEISRARTFGYMHEVEKLWAAGFAKGSSLENSVAIGDGKVLNPDGLRYRDEFARHKVLDAIGDLALAGAPIRGLYRSFRGGHRLNAAALAALLAQRDAWTIVTAAAEPVRVETPAELIAGLFEPALAQKVA